MTDANAGAARLFRERDYGSTHTSWILEIRFDEVRPAAAEPPEGITFRRYTPGIDDRAAYRLVEDAFNGLPGRDPAPYEEWEATVLHGAFSPQLSVLAFDGDELVGTALSYDYASTDEGWIQQLATRATHRHRGIARAMLNETFGAFHERGKRRCGLSTDSRTGALGLYERVGMSIRRSYTRYTKTL